MKYLIHLISIIIFAFWPQDNLFPQSFDTQNVPAWSEEAVWYQIFPERFRNGDPENDPVLEDVSSTWPYLAPEGWQIHPWTSDWYELQPWEISTGRDFYTNAGARRYGGDLQGVIDKLDYLTDLGINAIYFNPLFESPSHHKYDATFYHHIDNNFGPSPQKDGELWNTENPADPSSWKWSAADSLFLKLLHQCHKQGIRVIIDGVFNHVGYSFWAFQDVIKNQASSEFRDWFVINSWDDPSTPADEFSYSGWNGVRELPEIRETSGGLAPGFEDHLRAVVIRWMDPNGDGDPSDGIDGWRLDVAEKVNPNFWRTFRKWVKNINPDAILIGEIWWEDWPRNKMFNAAPWLQGDMFDGVMNYRFARAVKQLVIDREKKIPAKAFADSIRKILSDYPTEAVLASQNLMDSHDVERLASQIVNPDRWLDHGGNPVQNRLFDVRKPDSTEREKQKLIIALQMTLPGAPMIYYGDEAGMWGGDDPDCRKPMVWQEYAYAVEKSHPFHISRPADTVRFNHKLFQWTKKMIRLRRENKILAHGKINFQLPGTDQNILTFSRSNENRSFWIMANPENISQKIDLIGLPELKSGKWMNLVTGDVISVRRYELKPYELLILKEL